MKLPSYRFHKQSGQACVTIAGRMFYLGKHGTDESRAEYDRLIADHQAGRELRTKKEADRIGKTPKAPAKPAAKVPQLRHHQSSGQGYVTLNKKRMYCGKWDTPECKEKYDRLLAEFLTNGRTIVDKSEPMLINELVAAYLEHAKSYYGEGPTSEFHRVIPVLKVLRTLYREEPASNFGAIALETVRNKLCEPYTRIRRDREGNKYTQTKKRSREYINALIKKLRRMFKWAVAKEMVPPSVLQVIQAIEPLKKGRVDLEEPDDVPPVNLADYAATLPHLSKVLSDMCEFQLATGCRAGEMVIITPEMVDRSLDIWEIRPERHKTAYCDKDRIIYCNQKAQEILRPYLLRAHDAPCFSPQESKAQYFALRASKRKTPLSCGNKTGSNVTNKPKRQPGVKFTPQSFASAIRRTCIKHEIPHWHPHQLRHRFATDVRKDHGIEVAAILLGHQDIEVTQIYAEADRKRAIDVIRKLA